MYLTYNVCVFFVIVFFHSSEPRFLSSDECTAAGRLVEAYQNGSQEDLDECIKKSNALKFLTNSIAQLARKLKFPKSVLKEQPKKTDKPKSSSTANTQSFGGGRKKAQKEETDSEYESSEEDTKEAGDVDLT